MRILFVDDDIYLLRGMRRMLRQTAAQWEADFVASGVEAMDLIERKPFDLLVADMRMPGMDGMAVLRRAVHRVPGVIRCVLSGQVDREAALQAMPLAHQFLRKPSSPAQIQDIGQRVSRLHALLPDPDSRSYVGGIVGLPTSRVVLDQLRQALACEAADLEYVAELVAKDIALSAKVLHVAQTPFFGPAPRCLKVVEAARFLGPSSLRILADQENLFLPGDEDVIEASRQRGCLVADLLQFILPDEPQAFAMGMLHCIGDLVPAVEARPERREPDKLSAYLLGLWGASMAIVDAVASQADRELLNETELRLDTGLALAVRVADEATHGEALGSSSLPVDLDRLRERARSPRPRLPRA